MDNIMNPNLVCEDCGCKWTDENEWVMDCFACPNQQEYCLNCCACPDHEGALAYVPKGETEQSQGYKPQTVGELIKLLSDLNPDEIVIGALFTAEDLEFYPDLDTYADDYEAVTPSQELMAKVAKIYDNSNEAMFLSETLTGWITENNEGVKE